MRGQLWLTRAGLIGLLTLLAVSPWVAASPIGPYGAPAIGATGKTLRQASPEEVARAEAVDAAYRAARWVVGDADCNETADARDTLHVLRSVVQLETLVECLGAANVRCQDDLDSVDGLVILRSVVGLDVDLGRCLAIGEPRLVYLPQNGPPEVGEATATVFFVDGDWGFFQDDPDLLRLLQVKEYELFLDGQQVEQKVLIIDILTRAFHHGELSLGKHSVLITDPSREDRVLFQGDISVNGIDEARVNVERCLEEATCRATVERGLDLVFDSEAP